MSYYIPGNLFWTIRRDGCRHGGYDSREVEDDSDGEVDARDDLDAHAVLAVELVEEVVVPLLELGLRM